MSLNINNIVMLRKVLKRFKVQSIRFRTVWLSVPFITECKVLNMLLYVY